MSGGFDARGAGIPSRTEIGAAATPRVYGAGAGGFNRVAAGSPARSSRDLGGRPPRVWTAEEQAVLDAYFAGSITFSEASERLGCCTKTLRRHFGRAPVPAATRKPIGRAPRVFTEREDNLIRQAAAGTISRERARHLIGCAYEPINRRCAELGLKWPLKNIPAPAGDPSRPGAARTTRPRQAEPSSLKLPPVSDGRGASSAPPPAGWVVIATRTERGWQMTADAPVSPQDARKLVEQGRALTTQRRNGEGFDLLFRWRA